MLNCLFSDKNKPATNNSNTISVQTAPIAVTTPSVTTGQVTPTSPIKKVKQIPPQFHDCKRLNWCSVFSPKSLQT